MIFVLFEYWETPTSCVFHYKEVKNKTEATTFIANLHNLENPKSQWYKYRNIRIIEGNQNVIDHPFRGDNCQWTFML